MIHPESAASPDPGPRAPSRLRAAGSALLPWLVIAAAFAHAVVASWRRWGDLVVDTGRELDLPRRLANGELLYRDARFYYGPLAPYLNALLYRLFGIHSDVLMWAGIVSAALLAVALYRLAASFVTRWAAAAVVVAFVYLCAFAHLYVGAIFNFALPYTFSATYGIVAATWSVALLVDHIRTGRRAPFLLSVACLTLTALSKLETFVAVAAAHAVFLAAMLLQRSTRRGLYLASYAASAAAFAAIYGGFRYAVGPGLWSDNLAGVVNEGSRRFVLGVMGLGDPAGSLAAMGVSAALLAGTLGLSGLVARRLDRSNASSPAGWCATTAVALATFLSYRVWELHVHFRALPLAMVAALVVLAVALSRRSSRREEWLAHLVLWVFGFACLWRILLNARPHHYGFYLLPAGLVCLAVLFFDYGPRLSGSGPWARRVFGACGLGLFAASITIACADSRQFDRLHTRDLATSRGHLRILDRWGLEIAAVRALSSLPPDVRVAAIPEGSGLLFFAAVNPADTMFSYLPMEVVGQRGDKEILARWRSNPPDVTVWVNIPLDEFGSSGFGRDYGNAFVQWLLKEYVALTDPNEAIAVLVRAEELRRKPGLWHVELSPFHDEPGKTINGRVLDRFERGDGTFLRLDTLGAKTWVGVKRGNVDLGSQVTIFDVTPAALSDRGLRRRFEQLVVGRLDPPLVSVARLQSEKESFRDKDVAVRGTVVETLPSSGRVNRVRLRDASGLEGGSDDIVVLTLESLSVGDTVYVRGKLSVDQDFGAGRADALVVEGWRVTR